MNEAGVAAKLKEKNPGWLWEPVADRWGSGIPDRLVMLRGVGKVAVVELKCLQSLPKRSCRVGLKGKQAGWLERWVKEGGSGALIIGVTKERKVAVVVDGFRRIASEGMKREEFDLVRYEDVGTILKSLVSG